MKRSFYITCLLLGIWMAVFTTWPAISTAVADEAPRATVDRTRIGAGESLQLTVTVNDGDAVIDTSAITDFNILSEQTGSYTQIINGHYSKEIVHTYLLMPKRSGRLQIPALTIDIDGNVFHTDSITISVAQAADNQTNGSAGDVFVKAEVSTPDPYVGQQFIYTFSLYNAVQVTDARFQPPEFNGFSAKEIEERRTHREVINGREFSTVEIRYVLVPLAAGDQTIEPAVLQVGVVTRNKRRQSPFDDFFDSPFLNRGSVEQKIVQSQPLLLKVKPLPPFEGPGKFSGLVGQFKIEAGVENTQLAVGDSTTLTLTIQGNGNIMDAQLPVLAVPDGFKTYDDNPQEQVRLTPDGYTGQKIFRIALVPVAEGKYDLPPLAWTYFDDNQGSYRTITVNLPALYVTPGSGTDLSPVLVTPQVPGTDKEKVAFTGRDILPLITDLDAIEPHHPFPLWLFILCLAVPVVVFGGLTGIQHFTKKDSGPRAQMKAKAYQALKTADAALHKSGMDSTADFLTHLFKALTAAIFSAAGRSGEALTWHEAETLLLESGRDPETAHQAAQLLSTIESAKFSGAGVAQDKGGQLLEDTRTLVRRLAP